MKNKIRYVLYAVGSSVLLFLALGIPTALVPNPWFVRMIPGTSLDLFFLIASSILLGAYVGVHYYKKNNAKACNIASTAGGIGGVLAFGCPICNQLLVIIFGSTTLLTYFAPYQPILGVVSLLLLSAALVWRIKK